MALRSLALQIAEAALASSSAAGRAAATRSSAAGRVAATSSSSGPACSSSGAASAPPYYVELFASKAEAMMAARRASTGSAPRRTALFADACDPTNAFTAAVVYRVTSASTASNPPLASYLTIFSTKGPLSAAIDALEAALEKPGSRPPFTATQIWRANSASSSLSMAEADLKKLGPCLPLAASEIHRAATVPSLPDAEGPSSAPISACASRAPPSARTWGPFSSTIPLLGPASSTARSFSTEVHDEEASGEMEVEELIRIMQQKKFSPEEELKFRIAFHKIFFPYWGAALATEHLEYQTYTEEEWLRLLRLVYQKAGVGADAAIVQVKEGLDFCARTDSESPAIRRIEAKLDSTLKKLERLEKDNIVLREMCDQKKQKMEWGTVVVFGRKFDISKPITLVTSFLF